MPEDRRHAAIMFTDIVGYTALMGRDEDRAFDMLRRNHALHQHLIEKHHRILIKEIGDGTLANFPLSSNAIRCAIVIIKTFSDSWVVQLISISKSKLVNPGEKLSGFFVYENCKIYLLCRNFYIINDTYWK